MKSKGRKLRVKREEKEKVEVKKPKKEFKIEDCKGRQFG